MVTIRKKIDHRVWKSWDYSSKICIHNQGPLPRWWKLSRAINSPMDAMATTWPPHAHPQSTPHHTCHHMLTYNPHLTTHLTHGLHTITYSPHLTHARHGHHMLTHNPHLTTDLLTAQPCNPHLTIPHLHNSPMHPSPPQSHPTPHHTPHHDSPTTLKVTLTTHPCTPHPLKAIPRSACSHHNPHSHPIVWMQPTKPPHNHYIHHLQPHSLSNPLNPILSLPPPLFILHGTQLPCSLWLTHGHHMAIP